LKVAMAGTIVADGDHVTRYDEATGVITGVESAIIAYVVPALRIFHMRNIMVSGTNIGTYRVEVDGDTLAKKRSYYTEYNVDFAFDPDPAFGIKLEAGSTVVVYVRHDSGIANPGDFNATISGRLEIA
jgi:hypothetical protein